MSSTLCVEDTAVKEPNITQNDESDTFVEEEMPDEASSVQLLEKPAHKSSRETHKKRKGKDQVDNGFIEWMKMKKSANKSDQDAEHQFLLSLLPDLKNLSMHQRRIFKIQTMSLLHKLLEEDE
ncbi:uncharacterized protein LOC126100121 [Schistocerca cancellata]|uniref:uncharacterized protein LOC126100121 n=1 Tax=Schistocerca cancellata TaxID=274614 RepID=UPI002118FDBA|nr:uncharacterized protein LOC126100121 [Schistocerca cancellata]